MLPRQGDTMFTYKVEVTLASHAQVMRGDFEHHVSYVSVSAGSDVEAVEVACQFATASHPGVVMPTGALLLTFPT